MLRTVLTSLSWLALSAVPGTTAESASAPPRPGQNFTVTDPVLAMIWIAPGTFLMSGTLGTGDDTLVTLTRGYWLGRTEVTQEQWQAVIDYYPVPSQFKGSDRPVEKVAWETVILFCAKLTERERAAGRLPEGYEYTLPTEAQWEYACRAGTIGKYAGDLDAMAWYEANSDGQTHPVAQKQPNAWGLHDMHGNVMEWCADWYAGYAGGLLSDPTGPAIGQFRVYRGGGWNGSAGICRSAFRSWGRIPPGLPNLGFRVALAFIRRPSPGLPPESLPFKGR